MKGCMSKYAAHDKLLSLLETWEDEHGHREL